MLLDTPICEFGWQAPEFTLKDFDGVSYSLAQLMGEKGLLIAFICNHCPYVKAIAKRLAEDALELKHLGVNVAAIMPNDYQTNSADSPENMRQFAKQYQFEFPYLVDQDQSVAKAYDAVCTPDFFGLNTRAQLQYRGRLDNLGMGQNTQRIPELVNAMKLIANTAAGPLEQLASMGCSIKWK